jgi:hypothetical protein
MSRSPWCRSQAHLNADEQAAIRAYLITGSQRDYSALHAKSRTTLL